MKIIKRGIILSVLVCLGFGFAIGQIQQQTQTMQQEKVSDKELDMFINAFHDVQAINAVAQQEMLEVLAENNMDVERYNEIQHARQTGASAKEMTPEEQKNFENAGKAIGEIQVKIQREMESKIQESGITLVRYQEISMQVQQDPELREKFQAQISR